MNGGRAGFYRRLVTVTARTLLAMMVVFDCGFHERARVGATEEDYPVRLVGGDSPSEGRVEVLFNSQWGTVSDVGWDPTDASVVCRQLGLYGHNTSIDAAYFGQGTGPVLMANVHCNGSESRLTDCAFTGWGVTYSHAADASVWCQIAEVFPVRIVDGTYMKEGIAEIYFRGQWVRICDFNFQASSGSVICRELGFHGPNVSHMVKFAFEKHNPKDYTYFTNNFVCNGDERALADCSQGWKIDLSVFTFAVIVSCQIEDEEILSVRLTGGLSSNQGRLEVYSIGAWVGVGQKGWNDAATSVVCRQLGFFGPNVTIDSQFFVEETGKQFVSNVDCRGHETKLTDCRITNHLVALEQQTSIGIVCLAVDNHPLRLVGGNSSRTGLVEVFCNGHWMAVCMGYKIIDQRFARVVCTQLGFSGKSFPAYAHVFGNEHHTQDKYVRLRAPCRGNESRLVDCAPMHWGELPCPYWRAGVLCEIGEDVPVRLSNGFSNREGRVEIFLNDQWAAICNDHWNASAASVVCRQLGYPGRTFAFGVDQVYPQKFTHHIDCNGQEKRLADCSLFSFAEPCSYIAGVICQSNEDFPVRLLGGATNREGRVEILFNNQWGTVCDQNWDEADASVVCRQLGFYGASVALRNSFFGQGDGPVHMTNVNCRGDEEKLANCTFPTRGEFHFYFCRAHIGDAGVICESDEDFPIRLVGGQTSISGRVEMYFHGEWGTVSNFGWDAADARVVCRQLGFDGRSEAVVGPIFGVRHGFKYFYDTLPCFGNESRLFDCLRKENRAIGRWSKGHADDAGVICQSDEPLSLRLVDGFSDQSGRVEILFNGLWGMMCNFHRDINYANVVCNQLGFHGAQASVYTSLFGSGSGPVYSNNFVCVGNESMLADCTFTVWSVTPHCLKYAGVICNAARPKATTNSSSSNLPGSTVQEDQEQRNREYLQNVSSLEDVSLEPTVADSATELSRLLVKTTSLKKVDSSLSLEFIEELSGILHSIVNLGSGDLKVTDAVIGAVNSIVSALRAEGLPEEMPRSNLTLVTQLVEAQVSSSLRQNGQVSVQKDFIHVEAISLNYSQVNRGFTFAIFQSQPNVSNPGWSEPSRKGAALVAAETRIYQSTDDLPNDGVIAAVGVPTNIIKALQSENGNKTPPEIMFSFIMYADDTLFPSARIKRTNSQDESVFIIPGPVISFSVLGVELISLTELIAAEFQNVRAVSKIKKVECVFWNFSLESGVGDWSNTGCSLHVTTSDRYRCLCNHATNLAVLVEVQEEELKMHRSLNPIVQISCFVSSGVYLIFTVMYISVRKCHASISGKISLQLVLSLLMLHLFATAVKNGKRSTYGCTVVAFLLQYLPLTAMKWTAVEVRNLYTTTVTKTPRPALPYFMIAAGLIAWGFPVIVTGITFTFGTDNYGRDDFCILASSFQMYLGLVLPLCAILGHNVLTFCAVVRLLKKTSREHPLLHLTGRLGNDIAVCTLTAITMALGYLSIHGTSDTFPVIFCVANCSQILAVGCMCRVHAFEGQGALVSLSRDREEQTDRSGEDALSTPGSADIFMITTPSHESRKDGSKKAIREIMESPSRDNLSTNSPL